MSGDGLTLLARSTRELSPSLSEFYGVWGLLGSHVFSSLVTLLELSPSISDSGAEIERLLYGIAVVVVFGFDNRPFCSLRTCCLQRPPRYATRTRNHKFDRIRNVGLFVPSTLSLSPPTSAFSFLYPLTFSPDALPFCSEIS